MTIYQKLLAVQKALKAPKGQYNEFGKYKYRSCEDVLEAVKPLLEDFGLLLTLTDEIIPVGERIYVRATARLFDAEVDPKNILDSFLTVTAYAREEESKKGMDSSQVTGAASSYARKYALNGLFCIDDAKDSDFTNHHGKDEQPKKPQEKTCFDCGKPLTDAEDSWSIKKYGVPLCREHQAQHKPINAK